MVKKSLAGWAVRCSLSCSISSSGLCRLIQFRGSPRPCRHSTANFAENRVLQGMELFATPNGRGPEDVAVDSEGRIYVGLEEGQILRYAADGSNPEVFADTGGRPLGLDFDKDENLVVADAAKGLLSINPSWCDSGSMHRGRFCAVRLHRRRRRRFAERRMVFRCLSRVGPPSRDESTEAAASSSDISTGECAVVLDGLVFANGIAVSPDDTYVLVNETMRYRIQRVYVRGPRAGDVEVFIDNLPGFPDGISTGPDGTFWLALYAPRNALLDFAGPKPWLRKLIYRIPTAMQPKPRRHPFVLGLDATGKVVHNLQDADGADFSKSTSAEQVGDWLYVGSLTEPKWGRINLTSIE